VAIREASEPDLSAALDEVADDAKVEVSLRPLAAEAL
jgi:hypothetical protein